MQNSEEGPLKFLMGLSLLLSCAAVTMGGVVASLQTPSPLTLQRGIGGPEADRGPTPLSDPRSCGGGRHAVEWHCRGVVAAA